MRSAVIMRSTGCGSCVAAGSLRDGSASFSDSGRTAPEHFQRIDFVRCSWNSEFIPEDREVFTYRMGGNGAVGFDCLFTHKPDRRPIVRMERKGTVTVHPSCNGEIAVGESALPVPINSKELLPF